MTHFEDLTPYRYLDPVDRDSDEAAVNVGWLGSGHPFTAGQADAAAITGVLRLVRDSPVNRTRGWHRCDLCERPAEVSQEGYPYPARMELDGSPVLLGDCEIRVRDQAGVVYAAPSLLAHYMAAHGYLPPPDFLRDLRTTAGDLTLGDLT